MPPRLLPSHGRSTTNYKCRVRRAVGVRWGVTLKRRGCRISPASAAVPQNRGAPGRCRCANSRPCCPPCRPTGADGRPRCPSAPGSRRARRPAPHLHAAPLSHRRCLQAASGGVGGSAIRRALRQVPRLLRRRGRDLSLQPAQGRCRTPVGRALRRPARRPTRDAPRPAAGHPQRAVGSPAPWCARHPPPSSQQVPNPSHWAAATLNPAANPLAELRCALGSRRAALGWASTASTTPTPRRCPLCRASGLPVRSPAWCRS